MNIYLSLFTTFFKIGAFTFGGGYAMIPLISHEVTEKHKWLTDKDILDIVAIAESTPGPIAINAATFVGYRTGGIWGSVCATLGIVIPSFVCICIVSLILNQFMNFAPVRYAFYGIRAGVLALIAKALFTMAKKAEKSIFAYIIAAGAFIAALCSVNVLIIIASCALAGIIYTLTNAKKAGERK